MFEQHTSYRFGQKFPSDFPVYLKEKPEQILSRQNTLSKFSFPTSKGEWGDKNKGETKKENHNLHYEHLNTIPELKNWKSI